jgi:two-component system response regulator HydG
MNRSIMSRFHVLVVSDADTAAVVRSALSPACDCEIVRSGDAAVATVVRGHVDVVIADEATEGMHGLDLLEAMRARSAATPFILLGGSGDVASAAEAGRRGVFDFVVKPIDPLALVRSVERAAGTRRQPTEGARVDPSKETAFIIGTSSRFLETLAAIERVAHSSAPALLVGETGTGKDRLAARIHALGPRRHRPFVVVNAAALPATLLDSELFGHAVGSFTGATRARRGLIAEADGGTLFLDEIADLPLELQGRLLRVIECGAIRPVGSDHERTVDVRFVAATHAPLAAAVAERRFREDLFFRLHVLAIHIPPLRERREDIPALVDHFFARARRRSPHSPVKELSLAACERLTHAPWPGNVRELLAVVERLVVFGRHERIEASHIDGLDDVNAVYDDATSNGALPTLRELSLRHVEHVLARTHGDKASAAEILGIDVSTLYRWQRRRLS